VSVDFVEAVVIKWLRERCWFECSYWCGWCDQMVKVAVLVGV